MGPMRLLALAATGAAVLGMIMFLADRLTQPNFALLYSDLAMTDSGKIVAELETLGVPYRLAANGGQVLVPSDQVLRLRVSLAEQGLPTGGSMGYELFDQDSGLGTTNFVQSVNLVRALEGELARTMNAIDGVAAARVHLVLPRRELFQRQETEATASVFLRLRSQAGLGTTQVAAIQHLVAAAVSGLAPERVAVIDGSGNLLASGKDDPAAVGAGAARLDGFKRSYEDRLKRTIESLLEPTLGFGRVRVEVAAEINYDRTSVNEELFDPDGQVARSTQSVEDSSSETEPAAEVSASANLPQAESSSPPEAATSAARTEETVNYEISKSVRTRVVEGGTVERLSVAVLVDGTQQAGAEGQAPSYTSRSTEELAQIESLVKSAIGFDDQRGDRLQVVNMPFAPVETIEPEEQPLLGLGKADYFKIGEIAALALISILAILLVLRPLAMRLTNLPAGGGTALAGPAGMAGMIAGPQSTQLLAPPAGAGGGGGAATAIAPAPEIESLIDIDKVEGRVKASSVKKIGELVDRHPDQVLNILRGWMSENEG